MRIGVVLVFSLGSLIKPILGAASDTIPTCPRCANTMALRTAERRANAGSHFWGSSTYRKRSGTRHVERVYFATKDR